MVFIDNIKELIKVFENSTREEIGVALLSFENYISYGREVQNGDIKKLTEVYKWYDQNCSDNYPSLTNEVLEYPEIIICNMESGFVKDGYKIDINFGGRSFTDDSTSFDIDITDNKTGVLNINTQIEIKDSEINSNYDDDSFNTIYKAVKEVKKQIQNNSIEKYINNNYKI